MNIKRTFSASLLALGIAAIATPAHAWPTSIWNVPTAATTAGGNVHLGVYNYLNPTTGAGAIQNALLFGVLPGFEVAGLQGVAGLEVGIDTFGSYAVTNAKLQLLGEGEFLPGIALGGLGFLNTLNPTSAEQVKYVALTKGLGLGDFSLGHWTVGYFMADPTVVPTGNTGLMGGASFNLTDKFALSGDYWSGNLAESGYDVTLGYALAPNAYLTAGYYANPQITDSGLVIVGVDMDLPTGLWGK